jgi:hypothetical protein
MKKGASREPEVDQLSQFLNVLNAETERGLPITAGAMLDEVLAEILRAFMADNAETTRLLKGFNAPLGMFASRISACYALALIGEDEFQELSTIRKIRNNFAHTWKPKTFEDNSVIDLCGNLPWRGPGEHEGNAGPRSRFSMAVSMLLVDFMWRVRLVTRERREVGSWSNRARQ